MCPFAPSHEPGAIHRMVRIPAGERREFPEVPAELVTDGRGHGGVEVGDRVEDDLVADHVVGAREPVGVLPRYLARDREIAEHGSDIRQGGEQAGVGRDIVLDEGALVLGRPMVAHHIGERRVQRAVADFPREAIELPPHRLGGDRRFRQQLAQAMPERGAADRLTQRFRVGEAKLAERGGADAVVHIGILGTSLRREIGMEFLEPRQRPPCLRRSRLEPAPDLINVFGTGADSNLIDDRHSALPLPDAIGNVPHSGHSMRGRSM